MGRPGSSEGKHDEFLRVVPPEDGLFKYFTGHIAVNNLFNQPGSLFHLDLQRLGNPAADCVQGFLLIEFHLPTMEIIRVNVPEHYIGIGHGGFGPAQVITGWSRHGTSTLRPNLQFIAHRRVDPGDRAAACPYRPRFKHG